jgi:hypothetical protein
MIHLTSCEDAPPEVHLKELHMDERGVEAMFVGSAVRIFAEGLVEQFHADGGINYVEWNMHRADEGWFVLTMRRREGVSPGQLAAEQLVEIERLKRELTEAKGQTPCQPKSESPPRFPVPKITCRRLKSLSASMATARRSRWRSRRSPATT